MTEKERQDAKEFITIMANVVKETEGVIFDLNTLTIRNVDDVKQEQNNKSVSQFLNSLWGEE